MDEISYYAADLFAKVPIKIGLVIYRDKQLTSHPFSFYFLFTFLSLNNYSLRRNTKLKQKALNSSRSQISHAQMAFNIGPLICARLQSSQLREEYELQYVEQEKDGRDFPLATDSYANFP